MTTTTIETAATSTDASSRAAAAPTVLAVLHPKGGVGRSTTVWHLGAELALRGYSVRIEDLDQGAHLTRVFDAYPLGLGFDNHRNRKPVYRAARACIPGLGATAFAGLMSYESVWEAHHWHAILSKSQTEQHHEYLNQLLAIRDDVT